jgi:heme/copper-type cytochrome/quinol oxidase subunit 2
MVNLKKRAATLLALWTLDLFAAPNQTPSPHTIPLINTSLDGHLILFYACLAIGTLVFILMGYSLYQYRRNKHPKKNATPPFHRHAGAEWLWSLIPIILIGAMVWPTTKVMMQKQNPPPKQAMHPSPATSTRPLHQALHAFNPKNPANSSQTKRQHERQEAP